VPPFASVAIVAAVIGVAGLAVGLTLLGLPRTATWLRSPRPQATEPAGWPAMLQVLVETRNELARNALEDKNYQKAADVAGQTLEMVKAEQAPEDHAAAVAARKILSEARSELAAIEAAASDCETAYRAKDPATAATALLRLFERDPQHPVAVELAAKVKGPFKAAAGDASQLATAARARAAASPARATPEFRQADEALREATLAQKQGQFGSATRGFYVARDAFERARRFATVGAYGSPAGPASAVRSTRVSVSRGTTTVSGSQPAGIAGRIDFRTSVDSLADGDSFAVSVFFENTGQRSVALRELRTREAMALSGAAQAGEKKAPTASAATHPQSREIAPGERVLLFRLDRRWGGLTRWSLEVQVDSRSGPTWASTVTFQ